MILKILAVSKDPDFCQQTCIRNKTKTGRVLVIPTNNKLVNDKKQKLNDRSIQKKRRTCT